mmetsp:Transcript_5576/g.22564  ORF Transcript_5576/g.22564 Transcript_5576/m.22564 type:complete len:215 (+) Transcript_5576:1850-2494(+)
MKHPRHLFIATDHVLVDAQLHGVVVRHGHGARDDHRGHRRAEAGGRGRVRRPAEHGGDLRPSRHRRVQRRQEVLLGDQVRAVRPRDLESPERHSRQSADLGGDTQRRAGRRDVHVGSGGDGGGEPVVCRTRAVLPRVGGDFLDVRRVEEDAPGCENARLRRGGLVPEPDEVVLQRDAGLRLERRVELTEVPLQKRVIRRQRRARQTLLHGARLR